MIGILQLYSKGIEDETITNRPNITFFKYSYVANGLFYKDDYVLENIQIKWNDNYFFKIQKDIEYIGPMWLKVTIPYFQILEKISTTVSTTTNDSNLNEIIYDNHDTFLVIINSIYYLIPIIFLTSPNIKYYFSEIKFIDIKQYFNNIAEINILGDTFIHMLSFTPSEYSNHIIPLLLSQGHEYDKLALNIILNDKFYRKNLLTQNSFDLYISNYIEDKLITHYIDINKYDMYEYKMNQEVYYYYIQKTTQDYQYQDKNLLYNNSSNMNLIGNLQSSFTNTISYPDLNSLMNNGNNYYNTKKLTFDTTDINKEYIFIVWDANILL